MLLRRIPPKERLSQEPHRATAQVSRQDSPGCARHPKTNTAHTTSSTLAKGHGLLRTPEDGNAHHAGQDFHNTLINVNPYPRSRGARFVSRGGRGLVLDTFWSTVFGFHRGTRRTVPCPADDCSYPIGLPLARIELTHTSTPEVVEGNGNARNDSVGYPWRA